MPDRPHSKETNPTHSSRQWIWRALVICVTSAIFFFLASEFVAHSRSFDLEAVRDIIGELFLHLAIAFVVATAIIIVIEIKSHKILEEENIRFREQIAQDVYRALFDRILPPKVFDEVNIIMHHSIIREDCRYIITFLPHYTGMPNQTLVIRRQISYTVRNLLNQQYVFKVRSYHSEDAELSSEVWRGRNPYHLELKVNGTKVDLVEGKNLTVGEDFALVEQEVPLAPLGTATISLYGEEPAFLSAGRISYIQATPVAGIQIEIINGYRDRIRDVDIQMNHPGADEMKIDDLGHFRLDRAFLPGQGFQVKWKQTRDAG